MALNGWTTYDADDWEMLPSSGATEHAVGEANSDVLYFRGPWAQRFAFAQALTGSLHPLLPGCYCGRARIKPAAADLPPSVVIASPGVDWPVYTKGSQHWAVVELHYSTDFSVADWPCDITKPTIETGTELKLEYQSTGEVLLIDPELMKHEKNKAMEADGDKWGPRSQAGRKLISRGEFRLTWLYVEEPPVDTWRDQLKGRVNDATFLDVPAGCLLFDSYDLKPSTRFSLLDPFCWELTVIFQERWINVGSNTYGWNHEYGWSHSENKFGWWEVYMEDGDGNDVLRYEEEDFSDMFSYSLCSSSSGS